MVGALMGEAVLVPISEVGSLAVAVGWLATCLSALKGVGWDDDTKPGKGPTLAAGLGALISFVFILMKLLPFVPGYLTGVEYLSLVAWMAVGVFLRRMAKKG